MKIGKRFVFVIFSAFFCHSSVGQKPLIDTSLCGKWPPRVGIGYLSNNGEYVYYESYTIIDRRVTIKGIHNGWKKEIKDISSIVSFAADNHLFISMLLQDSLCLQTLGKDQQEVIPHVCSYKVSQSGNAEWLIYQLNTMNKEFVIRNLLTGKQRSFFHITGYQFSAGDQAVILQQEIDDTTLSLGWLELDNTAFINIWQGKYPDCFKFTSDGKGMAFIGSSDVPGKNALWYYRTGDKMAQMLIAENSSNGPTQGMTIVNLIAFNSNCNKLFINLQPIMARKIPDPNLANVDVYSYKDPKLQSQQLKDIEKKPSGYTYVFDLYGGKLFALEKENEHLIDRIEDQHKQNFVLIRTDNGGDVADEWNWNPAAQTSIYLLSIVDGTRKCLCKGKPFLISRSYQLSPDGKYIVFYSERLHNYCSYNIASGVTSNITKGAEADWVCELEEDMPDSSYCVQPRYHWAVNDEAVFIYGKDDIYQADPSGKLSVIRLTANYGRSHHAEFRFAELFWSEANGIELHEPLLLKVVNQDTRDEGYCKVMPGRENKPVLLKMMPYHLDLLQKARDAEVYTVQMESAECSPNQFLTMDFKKFSPLTHDHPEKAYNWITSELVHFKTLDGRITQGVLFKPENFDAKKKYPVIYEYYERNIAGLHNFYYPGYTDGGRLDIASYVSNGFLVFTPDIYYEVGYPGRSAYNAIVAGAQYLSQFAWVDKSRMGLMGHSFGGFETDYVVTHSHLFAAAVSMSGMTDFISAYGSIVGDGTSRQRQYELYRDRIGATLWQRPDLYIENSPVLRTDKITTPVLLMANKKDDDVPFEQGFEFFTALRRLGKKAWMLQYDNGGHQVFDQACCKDLSIRIAQFFNYYLKGEAAPKWMTEGITASLKGIDNGYQLMPGEEP
jgi:dienelactone hydrolase